MYRGIAEAGRQTAANRPWSLLKPLTDEAAAPYRMLPQKRWMRLQASSSSAVDAA